MQVILQPTGSSDNPHFVDTIEHRVDRDRILSQVDDADRRRLAEAFEGRTTIPTWGVTPGKGDVNARKWERVQPGDIALFSRENHIIGSAVIAAKVHSRPLAIELWRINDDQETWEYVYFLDELTNLSIPYEDFNYIAGYKPNNRIHGFNVLDPNKSARIAQALDLKTERYHPDESINDYREELKRRLLEKGETDEQRAGTQRLEQGALREALFGQHALAKCCMCGAEYSVDFLIAAHVKKRALCTIEERLDFSNVAAPMCKAGCDALYEQGLVIVDDAGAIREGRKGVPSTGVSALIGKIAGRTCAAWSATSEPYFAWHRNLFSP